MKITGYQLREAIKQQVLRRDTAAQVFPSSLRTFPDEEKDTPASVMNEFLLAEQAVAQLQVAQMRYNLEVQVTVVGERMTLAEAIKRVGAPARAEKMWRTATGPRMDRYRSLDDNVEMDPLKVRAKPTMTSKEALSRAQGAAKLAGAYRAAISLGNALEIEISGLDSALFE